jgi:hypothetical protein
MAACVMGIKQLVEKNRSNSNFAVARVMVLDRFTFFTSFLYCGMKDCHGLPVRWASSVVDEKPLVVGRLFVDFFIFAKRFMA